MRLRTLSNWFVGSADIKSAFRQMRIPGWLQAFFALPACLASEVGYTRKTVDQKRLPPDSLIVPVPTTLQVGFSWEMFLCQDVTDNRTLTGSVDSRLLICRNRSTPPLLGSRQGTGPLASVGRMLTN